MNQTNANKTQHRFDETAVKGLIITVVAIFTIAILVNAAFPGTITSMSNTSSLGGSVATATGTVTFSGNVTPGNAVNLTDPSGFKYVFEFNTTGRGGLATDTCYIYASSPGCIPVNVSYNLGWNSTPYEVGNLSKAINGNTTVSANVTSVNSTTVVTLTAITTGTLYNSMVLSTNGANIAVSGLSGGANSGYSSWSPSSQTAWAPVPTIVVVVIVIIFLVLLLSAISMI